MSDLETLSTLFFIVVLAVSLTVMLVVVVGYVLLLVWFLVGLALVIRAEGLTGRLFGLAQMAAAGTIMVGPPGVAVGYSLYLQVSTEAQQNQRAAEVAAFPRTPLPEDAPRVIVVWGWMNSAETALALHTLELDELYMFQGRQRDDLKGHHVVRAEAPDCAKSAWKSVRKTSGWPRQLGDCSTLSPVSTARSDLPENRLELFIGESSTLGVEKRLMGREGPYELRWNHTGQDDLVDYWENTFDVEDPKQVSTFLQETLHQKTPPTDLGAEEEDPAERLRKRRLERLKVRSDRSR